MTDDQTPPVGSLGEEAVKLLGALRSWADETATGHGTSDGAGHQASSAASLLAELNEHIATGGQDCKYCPVCQVISLARATSPEVKHHLGVAASSLVQAASALLAGPAQHGRAGDPGVEHIDLSEDWEDD